MKNIGRKAPFWAAAMAWVWLSGCGGGGGGGGNNNPPPSKTTPTVTVTPGSQTVATTQSLAVTVGVSGSSGTPTGTVTLSSGSYTSSAATLASGSASITVPAGALAAGTATLSASYTPDAAGSANYYSAGGTGSVSVTKAIPTVTVMPGSQSVTTVQSLTVNISVSGGSGAPAASGSVVLSSGGYTSSAAALSGGSASVIVPAGALAAGTATLSASYTPDTAGSSIYASASGTSSVSVSKATPTVTVTPASQSITTAQSLNVTITVSGGSGAPTATGTVTLPGGTSNLGPAALTNGSATITIPAGTLAIGNDLLTASYTPDTAGAANYNFATGAAANPVTVVKATPTVTVTPASQSITTTQSLGVTISVSGGSGAPAATGSVTISSGTYTSSAATLSAGSASITIPASTFTAGSYTLNASYSPDTGGAAIYNPASGTSSSVTVSSPPVITSFSANPTSIVAGSSSGAQLTAVFSGGTGAVSPGNISVTSGTPVNVNPTATTTYTLTVTPSTGSAVTQTLTLTVYPSVSVCTAPSCSGPQISSNFLGTNLAMWYDDITNATSILSAFNSAGITFVRWPGGSNSDLYHWATNSGCNNLYSVSKNTFANFETDIVQAGNLDLAVTANYGSNAACTGGGDPAEAAAWAAASVSDGNPIHYMTVGNENYGSWEYDLHPIKHDPTTYAAAVSGSSGYYSLIKAQSPTTQVGVVVDANCTTANGCTNGWDSTVLANAKNYYDFVEFHYYPQNPGNESDTYLVQQAAPNFTTNINIVKSELATAGKPNTPIYVGEIGSVSSNPGKQSWSITQGLYAAQILGEAMNDGVTHLTWWIGFGNCNGNQGSLSTSLYGWQTFGAYNIFSDGPGDLGYPNNSPCNYGSPIGAMSPTAQAFNLFQNVAIGGEYPQQTAVIDGTGYTRAYAATHSGGYALVLFNLNKSAPETVSVAIAGLGTSNGGVTVTTYDKKIYDQSDATCATDLGCSYDSGLTYPAWAGPTTTTMTGPVILPLTLTLQPWSMNVVIVKP